MALLYHWRRENYERDIEGIAAGTGDLVLQQNSPAFRAARPGERLWAFTLRRRDGRYVLAAHLTIAEVTEESGTYGRYTAEPVRGSTELYDIDRGADFEPLIRRLPLTVNARVFGQAFQGAAAVREIDDAADSAIERFARRQPRMQDAPVTGALVLAEQAETIGGAYDYWENVTGEQYHFPNKYRRKVRPGLPFVYYRGVRREGGARGEPEYFGHGRIGDVWTDPRDTGMSRPRWFCRIEDYEPFARSVAWRDGESRLERIPQNMFRDGVRDLPIETYKRVMASAGSSPLTSRNAQQVANLPAMPPLGQVRPQVLPGGDTLLAVVEARGQGGKQAHGGGPAPDSRYRRVVGRRAEDVVYRYLEAHRADERILRLRHPARDGLTPGWDIEYDREDGRLVKIEVKGSNASHFAAVEITAGEWRAARLHGPDYRLCLVANCLSNAPTLQFLDNPYASLERGTLVAVPTAWRISQVVRE